MKFRRLTVLICTSLVNCYRFYLYYLSSMLSIPYSLLGITLRRSSCSDKQLNIQLVSCVLYIRRLASALIWLGASQWSSFQGNSYPKGSAGPSWLGFLWISKKSGLNWSIIMVWVVSVLHSDCAVVVVVDGCFWGEWYVLCGCLFWWVLLDAVYIRGRWPIHYVFACE